MAALNSFIFHSFFSVCSELVVRNAWTRNEAVVWILKLKEALKCSWNSMFYIVLYIYVTSKLYFLQTFSPYKMIYCVKAFSTQKCIFLLEK